eukprot:2206682-Rhodomonas_salina.1
MSRAARSNCDAFPPKCDAFPPNSDAFLRAAAPRLGQRHTLCQYRTSLSRTAAYAMPVRYVSTAYAMSVPDFVSGT